MTPEEFPPILSRILKDIAYIGQTAPPAEIEYGPPCVCLINAGFESGMDAAAAAIVKSRLREFSLNGGLLKLHWSWRNPEVLGMDVSDSIGRYPVTVGRIRDLLQKNQVFRTH